MIVLPAQLQVMLGELRGRDPPPEEVLRRLYDINPNYRLTWTPPLPDRVFAGEVIEGRPALWWLHEVRPTNPHDGLRRKAAEHRLQRWERLPRAKREKKAGVPELCRDMMAGYHTLGSWPQIPMKGLPRFGSEGFFINLRAENAAVAAKVKQLDVEARLDQACDEETALEIDENPEFRAYLKDGYRQIAYEDWPLIFGGKVGLLFNETLKEKSDAGADGKQVDGSRQAGSDREPRQHPGRHVQGQRHGEEEVRAGGAGSPETGRRPADTRPN